MEHKEMREGEGKETQTQPQKIFGRIETITFYNPQSHYSVLKVRTDAGKKETIVGECFLPHVGENIVVHGEWVLHKNFGPQFKASHIHTKPPTSVLGIERYLASGAIKGIGKELAKKIVDVFGEQTFHVIDNEPEKLSAIPGLGKNKIKEIIRASKNQQGIKELISFFQGQGLSSKKALDVYTTYGDDAIKIVKQNPYVLSKDIFGIGFKIADVIAKNLGTAHNSFARIRAGLEFQLLEETKQGHTCYPKKLFLEETSTLLNISLDRLKEGLDQEIQAKVMVEKTIQNEQLIYHHVLEKYERESAQILKRLLATPKDTGSDSRPSFVASRSLFDNLLSHIMKHENMKLAPLQIESIYTALTQNVSIITGGPGTGKTTLTKTLVHLLRYLNIRFALASPTGRAAKRLSECTQNPTYTIHRLLKYQPETKDFYYGEKNKLPYSFLIIDEFGMVDILLFYHLMKAVSKHHALVFIGDADQLPSVGSGNVLHDLIQCEKIPTTRLTQIFRRTEESMINKVAHTILAAQIPIIPQHMKSDIVFIPVEEVDKGPQTLMDLMTHIVEEKKFNPITDVQVLAPMIKGHMGIYQLNLLLQKKFNPNPQKKIERASYSLGVNDKVIMLQNNYEFDVFNGDIGIISDINFENEECLIDFDTAQVPIPFSELHAIQLAYAMTIHKAQGSEYPCVILPVFLEHYIMLRRNLLYTAITRGKKLVILLGQRKALSIAIQSESRWKRWTGLSAMVQGHA